MNEADMHVQELKKQGRRILALFDESIIEKPESEKSEGLGPVVSSKAKRRDRSKRGLVFNFPPRKAITVVGMQWTGIVIAGMEGTIRVALMSWWTTKGAYETSLRQKQEEMLRKCVRQWGDLLLYVFDRGYGTGPWLRVLEGLRVRFVIRWKQGVMFIDPQGAMKKVWEIGRGKRYRAHKLIRDRTTGQKVCCDLWWTPIRHTEYGSQLYLVKARVKGHMWYLITKEPVRTEEQAWEIFFAYRRRWQIETSFRYGKSELAMESPRTKLLENRLKLLGIVTLIYAFLLFLLNPATEELRNALLYLKCHRTGKWQEGVMTPLYRLRWALSRLWDDFRPLLGIFSPPDLETIRALASFQCSKGSPKIRDDSLLRKWTNI
jgi:hypothetical protein